MAAGNGAWSEMQSLEGVSHFEFKIMFEFWP